MKRFSGLFFFQILVALTGVFLSLYLFEQHEKLKWGLQEGPSFCSWGGSFDCDAVNASRYSAVAGVPIAAVGVVFYALLALGTALRAYRAVSWLGLAGLAVDLALFIVQAVLLKNFCIVCIGTYLCTFLILLLNVKQSTGSFSLRQLSAAGQKAREPLTPLAAALCSMLLLGLVGYLWWLPSSFQNRGATVKSSKEPDAFYHEWKSQKAFDLQVRSDDASFGNITAPIQIVEFSDFECPHCKRAAFTMGVLIKKFENKIRFTFKNFPLDSSCNPNIPYQMHPRACQLAHLAKCAHKKGSFWKYHDLVFHEWSEKTTGTRTTDSLKELLKPVFSESEFLACAQNEDAKGEIQKDIRQASSLDVKGTPSVYINGKLVQFPLTLENLSRLIELEVK